MSNLNGTALENINRICIQMIGGNYLILNNVEVLFIEADRQVCHLNLINGNRHTAVRHLGYYKQGLIEQYGFIELSKSILVNTIHLQKYSPRERNIQLTSGQILPVAKTRQEVLNKLFRQMHDCWKYDNSAPSVASDDLEPASSLSYGTFTNENSK